MTDSNTNGHGLKDKIITEKLALLTQTGFPLTKFFLDNSEWNENMILERTKKISNALYAKVIF